MQIQPSSYLWVRFGGWDGEGGAGQHPHEGKGELGRVGGLPTPQNTTFGSPVYLEFEEIISWCMHNMCV